MNDKQMAGSIVKVQTKCGIGYSSTEFLMYLLKEEIWVEQGPAH